MGVILEEKGFDLCLSKGSLQSAAAQGRECIARRSRKGGAVGLCPSLLMTGLETTMPKADSVLDRAPGMPGVGLCEQRRPGELRCRDPRSEDHRAGFVVHSMLQGW